MRVVRNRYRGAATALEYHRGLPWYEPTPLVEVDAGFRVFVKDESSRFGLNAFKILGASWAMEGFGPRTFSCATDGNHGRAVAWMARRLRGNAVVFVPENMNARRVQALEDEGAQVVRVKGNYDQAVAHCDEESRRRGWQVISDTGYPGYREIPEKIVEGYGTLFAECDEQMPVPPAIVAIQAGVGGLLSAAVRHYRRGAEDPQIVCVEPEDADCLLESITSPGGHPRPAKGGQNSIMAGLNCGEVSRSAWPVNRAGVDLFVAIEDQWAIKAQRLMAPRVTAGESGAAGLAGLLALRGRGELELGPGTVALVVNTEGMTG